MHFSRIKITAATGKRPVRRSTLESFMLRSIQRIILCVPFALGAQIAAATVLTFDDLSGTGSVPTNYGGLTFNNWFYSNVPDPAYPPKSGATNLFTGDFGPSVTDGNASISFAAPIVLDGAYFSGYSGVSFKLYNSGILVRVSDALPDGGASGYGPTFLSSGYAGTVDKIVVSGIQGYYAMDDLTYHISAVPEPDIAALWLLGLAGVGIAARRRGQSAPND